MQCFEIFSSDFSLITPAISRDLHHGFFFDSSVQIDFQTVFSFQKIFSDRAQGGSEREILERFGIDSSHIITDSPRKVRAKESFVLLHFISLIKIRDLDRKNINYSQGGRRGKKGQGQGERSGIRYRLRRMNRRGTVQLISYYKYAIHPYILLLKSGPLQSSLIIMDGKFLIKNFFTFRF